MPWGDHVHWTVDILAAWMDRQIRNIGYCLIPYLVQFFPARATDAKFLTYHAPRNVQFKKRKLCLRALCAPLGNALGRCSTYGTALTGF